MTSVDHLNLLHLRAHQATLAFLAKIIQESVPLATTYLWLHKIHQSLEQHLALEDNVLMPIYQKHHHPQTKTGQPQNFRNDHRLLKTACLDLINLSAEALLKEWPNDILQTPLLNLYDLFEHHDTREDDYFYPIVLNHLNHEHMVACQKQWQQEVNLATQLEGNHAMLESIQFVQDIAQKYRHHCQYLKNNQISRLQIQTIFNNKIAKLSQAIIGQPLGSIDRRLKEKQLTRLWIAVLHHSQSLEGLTRP